VKAIHLKSERMAAMAPATTAFSRGSPEIMSAAKLTLPIRHNLVRLLAPKLYGNALKYRAPDSVPRASTCFVKERTQEKPLLVAEIGIWRGINAESILRTLNVATLYAVDPYTPYVESGVVKSMALSKEEARQRLAPFGDRVVWLYETSETAATEAPNGLDFVYIDANHQHEYVRQDIHLWFPKLSLNGIIGGHDFSKDCPGVIAAVTEFARNKALPLMIENTDWWVPTVRF
jgi:hypothetical protein